MILRIYADPIHIDHSILKSAIFINEPKGHQSSQKRHLTFLIGIKIV